MKTPTDTKEKTKRKIPLLLLIILAILFAAGSAGAFFWHQSRNYAEEVASPLEKSLADVGGIKKCNRSVDGRGPVSYQPRYNSVYEVDGDTKAAASTVKDAFKKDGYNLTEGPTPGNPKDNLFYGDNVSKQSTFDELQPGPVDLQLTVFGSTTASQLCGSADGKVTPSGKTIVRLTINLPEFKGK